MMFTGNPGVGKTTVSRLVAKLYKELGVSSNERVVEVKRLVSAWYVPGTHPRVSRYAHEVVVHTRHTCYLART